VQTADMSGHCGCEFVLPRGKNVDNDRSDLEKPLQRRSGVHIGRSSVPERTMRRILIDEQHHQLLLLSAAAFTPSSSSSPATGTPSGGYGLPSRRAISIDRAPGVTLSSRWLCRWRYVD